MSLVGDPGRQRFLVDLWADLNADNKTLDLEHEQLGLLLQKCRCGEEKGPWTWTAAIYQGIVSQDADAEEEIKPVGDFYAQKTDSHDTIDAKTVRTRSVLGGAYMLAWKCSKCKRDLWVWKPPKLEEKQKCIP